MSREDNLRRLLAPASLVLIGGSNLALPIKNTRDIGFKGDIWVVNPKYDQIAGVPCFKSIDDLPGVPDAAFVAVNAEHSIGIVSELAAKGCGGVVCYAAGFAETGDAGAALQQLLVEAAGDMALVGPNCYGLLNFAEGVALWPDRLSGQPTQRGVAIISQSGNVALNLTMQDRSLPITHVISVGNQAVMGAGDYIEPLLDDDRVSAIGFYLEGLKDIRGFSQAALKAAAKGVPLVVLKAGTSEIGTQLTLSHTSSLAGSDTLYQAMFDRLGVIRVQSLSELVETLKCAALCQLPEGDRVAVLTCSGGDSALLADDLERKGLPLPQLSETQQAELKPLLPGFASLSNPLDYNTAAWGDLEASRAIFSAMMGGEYDITLLALDFPRLGLGDDTEWQVAVDAMIAAQQQRGKTAMVVSNLPELLPESARQRLTAAGIAPLQGMRDAVSAVANLVRFSQRRRYIRQLDNPEQLLLREVRPQNGHNVSMLDEWSSKQLMAGFGLPVPNGCIADADDAGVQADRVGYPVVVKGVSDQLAHKTEAGAVALNLQSRAEVEAAVADMAAKLAGQGLSGVRYLVEPMESRCVGELIVGLKRDEQFSLALVIGTGGILVNLLNDSKTLLLPVSRDAVEDAIRSLQGFRLLDGYRGRPVADLDAAVDAVMSVADFAMEHWHEVVELDINPLMVRPRGEGAVAVDALVRLHSDTAGES